MIARPYGRFEAWQLCHQLVLAVYRVTRSFPVDERYGLTAQARRAAFSAVANIVEGSAKRGIGEFRRFLDISNGSIAELGYIVRLSAELGYLSAGESADIQRLQESASKLTWSLYASMPRR